MASQIAAISRLERWETTRYELLNTRISDLHLSIQDSPLQPLTERLNRELAARGFRFRPKYYLTDTWGCPNEVPIIGIPFYLADKRLARIEEEQTGEVEDDAAIMTLLRHEAGHAVNYAYRLWENSEWTEVFGAFSKPYHDHFDPQAYSRQFVHHLRSNPYGMTYAQKHPDEDFAETFAVWLTPRSSWRRRYRYWPALRKLTYVDGLMRQIRSRPPVRTGGRLLNPVEKMDQLLLKHYGDRAERFRAAAEGYVDDKLRELFPPVQGKAGRSVADLLVKYREELVARMTRWSDLNEGEATAILIKLEARARVLDSSYVRTRATRTLLDISALAMALAMEWAYTGRLVG